MPVPLVALGPGPTFNTLGKVDDKPVIAVQGLTTYPPSGNLNLTTVSVTDRLTLVNVLGQWAAPDRQVVPRSAIFTPGLSDEEVQEKNAEDFTTSEINAESAAVQELGLPSVVAVADVVAGSAADGKLKAGDRIATVDGTPVADPDAVNRLLEATKPGDTATVGFTRDGAAQSVTVTLGSAPDAPRGVLGVVLARLPKNGTVTVDLGGVGGPSAGLMFSLGIVDVLTPGDLTGGRFIAGTGAITADGAVQNIGGHPVQDGCRAGRGRHRLPAPGGGVRDGVARRAARTGTGESGHPARRRHRAERPQRRTHAARLPLNTAISGVRGPNGNPTPPP